MRRPGLIALVFLAGACANLPAGNPSPAPVVVGGYGTAGASDPGLAAAEKLAVDEVYRREPQRSLIESVMRESQVVAGTNYRFTIKMTGMNSYRVVVYRPLQGEISVSSFEKLS